MLLPPLTPELNVYDLQRSLDFYVNILGFSVAFDRPEEKFSTICLEGACFMLEEMKGRHAISEKEFIEQREWRTAELEYPYGRGMNILINVQNCDELYRRIQKAGYPIKFPIEERWYKVGEESIGVRQFMVMDPDGFLLRFDSAIDAKTSSKKN